MSYKALPIGVDDFVKIRKNNYYYVDKTLMIKDLLMQRGDVNLFTRPRRFGKTLTLSMLKTYFEIPIKHQNTHRLFDGLAIMACDETILSEQEKYPVIFLSLKGGKQATYELSWFRLTEEIKREYDRHRYVLEGDLSPEKKDVYLSILRRTAPEGIWLGALQFLSDCLSDYHKQPAIILIDEYDVPLENAWFSGFYDEMVRFIRSLFESALKTNESLNFAIVTGCLTLSSVLQSKNVRAKERERSSGNETNADFPTSFPQIVREEVGKSTILEPSIFTGLNNLNINSIMDSNYDEYFGFTPEEVFEMLGYYDMTDQMPEMKNWYDGYRFGQAEVYNPWSVIKRVYDLRGNINALPVAYWANTSANSIVRELIDRADMDGKEMIETLISGGSIVKQIHDEITYGDIYKNEDNLWNFLFFTGYLKMLDLTLVTGNIREATLTIPNEEVRYIYATTIKEWFDKKLQTQDFTAFYKGVLTGDAKAVQTGLNEALYGAMSYNDYHEAFYHGFVAGLLRGAGGYRILSNRESGIGRFDLAMRPVQYPGTVILFEFKVVSNNKALEPACRLALSQIVDKAYEDDFRADGFEDFIHFGVAFCRKTAFVRTPD
ncbi:MAG: AAA family ATPase [Eubacterium sp.]